MKWQKTFLIVALTVPVTLSVPELGKAKQHKTTSHLQKHAYKMEIAQ